MAASCSTKYRLVPISTTFEIKLATTNERTICRLSPRVISASKRRPSPSASCSKACSVVDDDWFDLIISWSIRIRLIWFVWVFFPRWLLKNKNKNKTKFRVALSAFEANCASRSEGSLQSPPIVCFLSFVSSNSVCLFDIDIDHRHRKRTSRRTFLCMAKRSRSPTLDW